MSQPFSMQTVLVADDDPSIHAIFGKLLQPLGVRLLSCHDGVSARARAQEERPDLVFLDVVMPGQDGIEVCRALRSLPGTSVVPILLMSAHGDLKDRLNGLEAGANDYLVKPVEIPEVVAKVRTYLELSRLQRKLLEAERRRAVTGLLRGLAHQFNNILCGISGTAQILDLRVVEGDPCKDLARTIVQYSQRAATISQQLLALAGTRWETGDGNFQDVQESIRSAWDAAQAGTSRSHRLDIRGRVPDGIRLRMGSADLQACLFHLMQNSIHAMTDGGSVVLAIEETAGALRISLVDSGRGMSPSEMDKALEPFYQNWDRPTDAGLGLPFARALAEEAGGSLDLRSNQGEGTIAILEIPVH